MTTRVGAMPNQIEGTIDGVPFYFRARHGSWTLELKEWDGAKQNFHYIAEGEGERLGLWQEAPGWWEPEDALAFCRSLIGKYLDGIYGRGKQKENPA